MNKSFLFLCFLTINLFGMQQQAHQIPNNDVGITLETIVSRYKNPVRVMLANVIYEKDRMADDCSEQYIFKTCGTIKELLKVAAGATATCRIPIPVLTVGPDSQTCLLIEDENSSFYNDQYANVWLRKFSDIKQTFFEFPKIDETKKDCDPDSPIGVSLELYNKDRLGHYPFHYYFVKATSRIISKEDQ